MGVGRVSKPARHYQWVDMPIYDCLVGAIPVSRPIALTTHVISNERSEEEFLWGSSTLCFS